MFPLLDLYHNQFLVFVLVLGRISGLVASAPIFASRIIPMHIKALLAIALALLITPLEWTSVVADPGNIVNLLVLLGKELLVGLTLGLGVAILFAGLHVAGQIVSQMSAINLANVVDPAFNEEVTVFSQLFDVVALSAFLLIGGHRTVMSALLETFRWLPVSDVPFASGVVATLIDILTQSFLLGIRAAAPTMVALFMAMLVLGLISRTLPQLNILVVGFSVNTVVLIATLAVTLGGIVWIFQDQVDPTLNALKSVLKQAAG